MLTPGQSVEVQGSAAKPYVVKNIDGIVWSCTCMAWKNSGGKVDKKSCKHIRQVHGEAAEAARIGAAPVINKNTKTATTTPNKVASVQAFSYVSPGCDCENDSFCNVSHDPATCPCYQCVLATRTANEEIRIGRKLRQDEKASLNGPPIILAHKWDGELDPAGWWMSEKKDGVRAYFNGRFISRQGNIYTAPAWFKNSLPQGVVLDGELFLGRKRFDETISIVKTLNSGDAWKQIQFQVFDAPNHPGTFEERIEYCRRILTGNPYASVLDQTACTGIDHLKQELARIESLGGEGVMIRKPSSSYETGKSYSLLKVKSFVDCEAEVVGYIPGKGHLKGMVGSLQCRLPDGTCFDVGSGLTHPIRRNPPKIGSQITVRYQELTKDGVPRGPVFVAVRDYE